MSDVLNFSNGVRTFLNQKLPLPVAYKLNKINNSAEKEIEFYREKFSEIIQKYGKKDESGNFVFSEDGEQILIKDDELAECNKEIKELLDLNVEIENFNLKIEDFGENVECTAEEIGNISAFFND